MYKKLVDLYAGRELSTELEIEMYQAAQQNPELALEMTQLRDTVDGLHQLAPIEFTEETSQRILMKIYAKGIEIQQPSPVPFHLQYQLPIQS